MPNIWQVPPGTTRQTDSLSSQKHEIHLLLAHKQKPGDKTRKYERMSWSIYFQRAKLNGVKKELRLMVGNWTQSADSYSKVRCVCWTWLSLKDHHQLAASFAPVTFVTTTRGLMIWASTSNKHTALIMMVKMKGGGGAGERGLQRFFLEGKIKSDCSG